MKICNIEARPGEKKKGVLPVDGAPGIPLWLVQGGEPGPTLLVTAGVHGCEFVGMLAARTLFERVDAASMRGRLLIVPLVNAQGFYRGLKQIVPDDGKNLNRVFPGRADGTQSERMAYAIRNELFAAADFLVDLHGADINEDIVPLLFFSRVAEPAVVEKSRAAAACLDLEYRIPSVSKNALFSNAAQFGVPGMLLEIGGRGAWSGQEVERCIGCIERLMGHLNMSGEGAFNPAQREAAQAEFIDAEGDGFWFPAVTAGQFVKEGELLGVLCDLDAPAPVEPTDWDNIGQVPDSMELQRVTARFDGMVMYYTTTLGVSAGDPLVAYCRLCD